MTEGARRGSWLLISGGGTAGHAVAGLAVARELVERGHDPETIEFVGSRRGSEGPVLATAGFPVTLLPGRGINERKVNVANLMAAGSLGWAAARGVGLVARRRPRVVLSLGGYASLPAALGAVLLRRPLVLADSNVIPAASNRVVGRFAKASAVAFPGTALPRAVVTGNPVRPEILAVDRSPSGRARARAALGIPDGRLVVAAAGGSLGSRRINTAMFGLARAWKHRTELAIHHSVGRRDWKSVQAELPTPPTPGLHYRAVEYEDHMEDVLAAADLFVCRAGGSTLAELALVGVPAILVPLPIASEDHQTANAQLVAAGGGAVVVPDGELTDARLAAEVDRLVGEPVTLATMGEAIAVHGHREAAARVADLLESAAS